MLNDEEMSPGRGARFARLLGLLLASHCAIACGDGRTRTRKIENVRVAEFIGDVRPWGLGPERRFGLRTPGAVSSTTSSGDLTWSTPEGWVEREPSGMRAADFAVGEGECYLTMLSGGGGGLEANVQRWRQQFGLQPLSTSELEALPRTPFFGTSGVLVDFTGTYGGMGGGESLADYGLLGLLAFTDEGARFLKFTGPRALVESQREAFLGLGGSMRPSGSSETQGHSGSGTQMSVSEDAAEAPSPTLQRAAGLAWDAPASWTREADRAFRVVTFKSSGGEGPECYITMLGGDGGGPELNITRWAKQLGTELLPGVVQKRETLEILGGSGELVEIHGSLNGEPTVLLGVVRQLADRSVFVKMVGASDAVLSEADNFRSFVQSLTRNG